MCIRDSLQAGLFSGRILFYFADVSAGGQSARGHRAGVGGADGLHLHACLLYTSGLLANLPCNPSIMRVKTYSLGCSLVAMFNRVAGGNYTKACLLYTSPAVRWRRLPMLSSSG